MEAANCGEAKWRGFPEILRLKCREEAWMSGGATSLSLLQKCRNIPLICKDMNVYLHTVNIPPLPAETVLAP
ncbi:hypothetical protein D3C73_1398310 [compost metagenome]|uniref:Uncharacterized protein n=1 Tax=Paenibacillus jilunlii TaxID=682956 RepID=A0A1G9WFI4_9BACL|nr:hypothetical protein AML91_17645 [Paenibacillus jilunlii]SDM83067.1 hypothetical protein SAMN05216191_11946 [Paenibacillus jilunlii]